MFLINCRKLCPGGRTGFPGRRGCATSRGTKYSPCMPGCTRCRAPRGR